MRGTVQCSFSRKRSNFRHFLQSKFTAGSSLVFMELIHSSEERFLFCWLVMSCCRNGFTAGTFAGRRCGWFGQFFQWIVNRRLVSQSYFVFPRIFPRRSHYGSTTLQANKKEITVRTNAILDRNLPVAIFPSPLPMTPCALQSILLPNLLIPQNT